MGSTNHYPEIQRNDFEKISNQLDTNIPQQLQWYVFVIVGLFFARRGCENYDQMKKTDFTFDKTTTGRRCIRYTKDELTKNHRENDVERSCEGLIIETNTSKCPVVIF